LAEDNPLHFSLESTKGQQMAGPKTATYGELLAELQKLTPEQLATNVTVYVQGVSEYYPVAGNLLVSDVTDDVLDLGHPYLKI
jgi:hypothetical protein